jgi:hypothetical protein
MPSEPNFGPYASWESVSAFMDLSEKAFSLFDKTVEANWSKLSRPVYHLFLRMAYQAKTTSMSIRLSNSWALVLPALALVRVRLEQLIICSYLLHEKEEVGLSNFVTRIPIQQFLHHKAAIENPDLKKELSKIMDVNKSKTEAIKAQEKLTPGFSIDNDDLQRNWTKLDLRSMAKRRDRLASAVNKKSPEKLEREYVSIYKVSSSIVHAECSSMSYAFLDLFGTPETGAVLMAVPSWALIVTACTSHYDMLQCCEILNYLGIPMKGEYGDG